MKRRYKSESMLLPSCMQLFKFLPELICLNSKRRYFYHERADKKHHMEYTFTVKEMKFLLSFKYSLTLKENLQFKKRTKFI